MQRSNCRITVTRGMYLYLAGLLLLLPLRWLIALSISAAVHELFHLAAIRMFNLRVYGIQIGPFGARIRTEPMKPGQELLCALAGPLGALSLLLAAKWMPMTALCAMFQSLYNLLPIYPFDGGRALRSAASLVMPDKAATPVCAFLGRTVMILLAVLLLGMMVRFHMGLLPLLVVFIHLLGRIRGKIPCKDAADRVQ